MSVIILTTGQPGAGKSYSRVRWLVTDFLPNSSGHYITNLPLNIDLICEHLAKKTGKDFSYFYNRLHVIPDEELKSWRDLALLDKQELTKIKDDKGFRPGEYFSTFDLQGAHIAIDEFHRYCSKSDPILLKKIWNDWFAEVRKLGCTFEAITQDINQVPRDFFGKVGQKIDLAPFANTRDPFFKIKMYDWYQLRGGLTGFIDSSIEEVESIKDISNTGGVKWKESRRDRYGMDSSIFVFYNSFQKSDNSNKVQDFSCPALVYKKRIIFWFLRRNFFSIFGRIFLVVLVSWLCFFGGLGLFIEGFLNSSKKIASSNGGDMDLFTDKGKGRGDVEKKEKVSSTYFSGERSSLRFPVVVDSSLKRDADSFYFRDLSVFQDSKVVLDILEDYKPALFLDEKLYLRNGIMIQKNFILKGGYYDKMQVTDVDSQLRTYTLDSQYIFYMY